MALIEVSPIQIPGEPGVVAIAGLLEKVIDKADPKDVAEIVRRFLEVMEPYHRINVAISQNIAAFLGKILHVDAASIKYVEPPKLSLALSTPTVPVPPSPIKLG